ncbi:cilia- and flagella-associated protein 298 isoform X3 [Anabrus simplex]|uniref:cilia- and flagella-associated protein 298 isoform X3 n=1 Tax=Anabrus simplex TaxID=316456 RepID=UPI0035A35D6E
MVKLLVKRRDENQFLYETTLNTPVKDVLEEILSIFNGRLKVRRICSEMESLAEHGVMLPPNMQGLTEEQWEDLKLKDEWGERCIPSGGFVFNKDVMGRRNGRQPNEKMRDLIAKAVEEGKHTVSRKQVDAGICVTEKMIANALDVLKGTVMIVYPMGLPPYDVLRHEFENVEDLSGTQASTEVIEIAEAQLWFCGKQMEINKKLIDYLGKNEKTKVIVKLQKQKEGPPGREAVMSEEERKQLMLHAHRRQEELKVPH